MTHEKTATQRYAEALRGNAATAEKYAKTANMPQHFLRYAERQRRKAAHIEAMESDLARIAKLQEKGATLQEIARATGVAVGTVSRRKKLGAQWRHLAEHWERMFQRDQREYGMLLKYDRTGTLPRLEMGEEAAGKYFIHSANPLERIAAASILGRRGGLSRAANMSLDELSAQGKRAAAARKTIGREGGLRTFKCLCGGTTCPICYMRNRQRVSRLRRTCKACGYFDFDSRRVGDVVECARCGSREPGYTDAEVEAKLEQAKRGDKKKARELAAA